MGVPSFFMLEASCPCVQVGISSRPLTPEKAQRSLVEHSVIPTTEEWGVEYNKIPENYSFYHKKNSKRIQAHASFIF